MNMEFNKIEKQFREKLNSREISPNGNSWDRLDTMLSVTEDKKSKPYISWFFIAASLLVFLSVGMYLFNQNDLKNSIQQNVVEVEKTNNKVPKIKIKVPIILNNELKTTIVSTESKNPKPKKITNQQVSIYNQKVKSNQNFINKEKEIDYQNSEVIALKELPKIITKNSATITNNANISKSDELLLNSIEMKINQATNSKSTVTIDPKTLLSQVDEELDLSFREKVINSLNKNYKNIKETFANRNIE